MAKKRPKPDEVIEELKENEEFISRDDIEISVAVSDEDPIVFVAFSGFADDEDAEEYAEFLAETLPLLLFESTRLQ
jgi:hypothetical protein